MLVKHHLARRAVQTGESQREGDGIKPAQHASLAVQLPKSVFQPGIPKRLWRPGGLDHQHVEINIILFRTGFNLCPGHPILESLGGAILLDAVTYGISKLLL